MVFGESGMIKKSIGYDVGIQAALLHGVFTQMSDTCRTLVVTATILDLPGAAGGAITSTDKAADISS